MYAVSVCNFGCTFMHFYNLEIYKQTFLGCLIHRHDDEHASRFSNITLLSWGIAVYVQINWDISETTLYTSNVGLIKMLQTW